VFEFFKKRGDAVLLWRPHPLLESTINSMRPWLAGEYAEIVREFKSGGYGIFDDSPDLYRAFAWSDAYYGDGSSVMLMFGIAGKPIMVQDAARKNESSGDLQDGGGTLSEKAVQEQNKNHPALFYKDVKRRLSANECNFYEKRLSLQDFLSYVVNESAEKTAFTAKQIETYRDVAANIDGTCGAKVHEYVKKEALNLRPA
jgi:hypothetical protein